MSERIEKNYLKDALLFKALGDANRLLIIDYLKDGECCACKLLEQLRISQPTLSHHMRILNECGVVHARKDGKWMHYSLNRATIFELRTLLESLSLSHLTNTSERACI